MNTKQKILEKALQLFNERGYANVGVREIARSLDISPGNLSYHFSKKEDIFFELIKHYSQNNNDNYEEYFAGEQSIANFLELMHNILKSQYRHRGIFLSFNVVSQDIQNEDRSNYTLVNKKRLTSVKKILENLFDAGQLVTTPSDIAFLVSFFSLFGRFSIMEAFLMQKERDEQEVLSHYVGLLAKQMSLFASTSGKESIEQFMEKYAQGSKGFPESPD